MTVNPWYIQGSLQNVRSKEGQITGFQFIYEESRFPMMYVTHRMILFVDGKEVEDANLHLTRDGVTVAAADLPTTKWVCSLGESVQFAADYPGGLSTGMHTIRIDAVFGGGGGGGVPSGPRPNQIISFQAEVK